MNVVGGGLVFITIIIFWQIAWIHEVLYFLAYVQEQIYLL